MVTDSNRVTLILENVLQKAILTAYRGSTISVTYHTFLMRPDAGMLEISVRISCD